MSALGFTKAAGKPADVAIRYLAVRSTSIDLKKLSEIEKAGGDKAGADYTVGRLIIAMQDVKTGKQLWAADCVERLNPAVAERDATIRQVATRMFETYPTKGRRSRPAYFGSCRARPCFCSSLIHSFTRSSMNLPSVFGFLVSLTAAHINAFRGTL